MREHQLPIVTLPTSVYYTPTAQDNMHDKCVATWMEKMSDTQGCIGHLGNVLSGNSTFSHLSVTDLQAVCEEKKHTFTIGDAEHLCEHLSDAHRVFWKEYKSENQEDRRGCGL